MSVIKVILICQFTVLSFLFYLHLHCLCPTLHHTVFLIIPKYVYLQAGYGFFKIRKMQRAECMKLQILPLKLIYTIRKKLKKVTYINTVK